MQTLQINRQDSLPVFLDGDTELDAIRQSEPDRRKVIVAVALRRAQQIALNYCKRHAPELLAEFQSGFSGRKLLAGGN